MSNVDCGACPNISDGCQGICEKVELGVPRWNANWHMEEFYQSKYGDFVRASDYAAAQSELAAYKQGAQVESDAADEARRELAALREELTNTNNKFVGAMAALGSKIKALAAAEQRNSEMIELLTSIKLGDPDKQYLSYPMHRRIDAALKPTESGASE